MGLKGVLKTRTSWLSTFKRTLGFTKGGNREINVNVDHKRIGFEKRRSWGAVEKHFSVKLRCVGGGGRSGGGGVCIMLKIKTGKARRVSITLGNPREEILKIWWYSEGVRGKKQKKNPEEEAVKN